jgi:hypothetical protein
MRQGHFIDDLAHHLGKVTKQIHASIPPGVRAAQKDIEKNIHAILHNAFSKLDLVTREEFDAQANVLAKTRKKLELLEKKVAEIEHKRRVTTAAKDKKK